MNRRLSTVFTTMLAVATAFAVFDCSGPEGPAGPAGSPGGQSTQGTPGLQGPVGPVGPMGAAVQTDGGLPASCLSPCHGFNGIVEQWKTSTHYAAFISNLGGSEVDTWTGAGPCGNCHATDGLALRLAGQVDTVGGMSVTNLASGELGYKSAAGAYSESTYAGNSKVASVACVTCHNVTNENDPHRTGAPYTPGSFPLRVATGKDDQALLEKSPTVDSVVGTPAGKLATANTCVFCHKSRKDVTAFIAATNKLTSTYWGPHEGPQADVFSGAGGYHFVGKTYGTSTHQLSLTCVDCHMPDTKSNGGSPNHSFYAQLEACGGCHAGATSFDIAGGQSQIRAAMTELEKALNDAGWITRGTAAPYGPVGASSLGSHFELDLSRPDGTPQLTADQAGALYNYFLIARGGALGIHNPKYVKQLIFDSYVAVTGTNPTSLIRP
jgi:hypothetical protein